MDPSVAVGLIALGGVVIGGLINGGVTWRMERRNEQRAAKKAARLFIPRLNRIAGAMTATAMEGNVEWAELCDVTEGT